MVDHIPATEERGDAWSDEFDEFDDEDDTVAAAGGSAVTGPGEVVIAPATEDRDDRLDKLVARHLPDRSRTFVRQLIEDGHVLVDGLVRRPSFSVTPGQRITVSTPPPAPELIARPEPIPLTVVYEDDHVLVIDKPAGMVVHPAPGHPTGTLVNAVLHHDPSITVGNRLRPGIVHRLDKDTSGLIVVAKTDRARNGLVAQWQARTVDKGYVALVFGTVPDDEATVDAPIGRHPTQRQRMAVVRTGRPAVTHFRVTERFERYTMLDLSIETGRTHQIRVHMAFIGHPVVGDTVYGADRQGIRVGKRHLLHAARLGFDLPTGERKTFHSALPPAVTAILNRLRDDER
ncbi:MAG: RluA family pseudouridine synthase [Chloroflexota bacterium]|nr:RluA family pseudouridine synthase [Chloroflexota bacterium]